jgi:hypothetical protein
VTFFSKKRLLKLPEKFKVRFTHQPLKGPVEFEKKEVLTKAPEVKAERSTGIREVWKILPLKQKILTVIIIILITPVIVFSMYWIVTWNFEPNIGHIIILILCYPILFSILFMLGKRTQTLKIQEINFKRTTSASAFEVDEFKRIFPTCPICGSDSGYDATTKFMTPYVRCKSCGAVWEKVVTGPIWKLERRYLLVEPDKDMQASFLVRKGDVAPFPYSLPPFYKCNLGYKIEFWKSLDLKGLKRASEPTASYLALTDLEEEVLDYIDKHGGEISIQEASKGLGLSEARLKATIDKLKEKGYIE